MVKEEKLDCCITNEEPNCCDPDDKYVHNIYHIPRFSESEHKKLIIVQ
jgi:hypothetical protein